MNSNVRHLTHHLCPKSEHDCWRWNIRQLASRFELFNGVRILAIVTDFSTVEADEALNYAESLGMRFDHVLRLPNSRLREVVTWLPMLEILRPESADDNEVVFYGHSKGVRHHQTLDHITLWAETMYRTCLDDWPKVEEHLSRFLATGPFRRFGDFDNRHGWYYSGTFFWWRLAAIGRRDWRKVDEKHYGTESWIGDKCSVEETGCLLLDHCGDLYDPDYLKNALLIGLKTL